jgi:hypothetical protein
MHILSEYFAAFSWIHVSVLMYISVQWCIGFWAAKVFAKPLQVRQIAAGGSGRHSKSSTGLVG